MAVLLALFWVGSESPASADHPNLRIAGVGANLHNNAANAIPLDIPGATVTRISAAAFNAQSVARLRANYDVIILTWATNPALNADWNTRLQPYMALGGGVIYDGDPWNVGDLAPGVSAAVFEQYGSSTVTANIPGLTDGIINSFVNNHVSYNLRLSDPALSPFLVKSGQIVGVWGRFDNGCFVGTGPDQDFHGLRSGNQYNLLLNEVNFVTHCGPTPPGDGRLEFLSLDTVDLQILESCPIEDPNIGDPCDFAQSPDWKISNQNVPDHGDDFATMITFVPPDVLPVGNPDGVSDCTVAGSMESSGAASPTFVTFTGNVGQDAVFLPGAGTEQSYKADVVITCPFNPALIGLPIFVKVEVDHADDDIPVSRPDNNDVTPLNNVIIGTLIIR